MSVINGFASFKSDISSLYWKRICVLMNDRGVKNNRNEDVLSEENVCLSGSDATSFFSDGEYMCVFCGEITNRKTLKEKLGDMGCTVKNEDAALFVDTYKTIGARGVAMIFGEFSACIWDSLKKKLLVFRDKSGVYPLYYAYAGERFVFSSAVDSILRFPGIYSSVSLRGIKDLFYDCTKQNPLSTPFEQIKRVPPGCFAEFSDKGVFVKTYYSLSPSDKFNSEFIAKDAMRIREGATLCCTKEPSGLSLIFSALDVVEFCGFPVYVPVYSLMSVIGKCSEEKISVPFLPPDIAPLNLSFLIRKELFGCEDNDNIKNDSDFNCERAGAVLFDDEMKLRAWEEIKSRVTGTYSMWNECLMRFGEMWEKRISLPLSDTRFLECVTDGGGKDYIYKGKVFLPECDYVRKALLNELGDGERVLFTFLDRQKTFDFIKKTDNVTALLYILQCDYWTQRYHVLIDENLKI